MWKMYLKLGKVLESLQEIFLEDSQRPSKTASAPSPPPTQSRVLM